MTVLQSKNKELVEARSQIGSARLRKNEFQHKLRLEESREHDLKKLKEHHEKEIPERMKKLDELASKIEDQQEKNIKLQQVMKDYDVPTVDVYIELKLSLARLEKREEALVRKQKLEKLKQKNMKVAETKHLEKATARLSRRPSKFASIPGRIFHGPTFNIVYNAELIRS